MSKKDLERAFLKLKEENERLKEENAYLKFELEELKSKRYKSNRKKPPDDTPAPPITPAKKRGGLFGHIAMECNGIHRMKIVSWESCPLNTGNKPTGL